MKPSNWLYEQKDEPLFPDLIWSRPVTKQGSGKLLIIGGQAQEFSHVASAYMAAEQAGAGTIRVLMPSATEKYTKMLPNIEYAPSNPSGSFSRTALASFLELSEWADHVLLAGDLGKNSETTTILDGYLLKCPRSVTISENALSSIAMPRLQLLQRPITLALSTAPLQKIVMEFELTTPLTSSSNRDQIADILRQISLKSRGSILYRPNKDSVWVAHEGRVVASKGQLRDVVQDSAHAAVWNMQQPSKPFESLASSLIA